MEENLANQRRSYEKSSLNREDLTSKPMDLFKRWFDEVERIDPHTENNAVTVCTIDENGYPKGRVVLLKKFDDSGFIFYTNYTSEKGRSLLRNPKVSLSFFWPIVERQVIVKGQAEQLSPSESDEYFAVRPRGSQIGAWVSYQSREISSRKVLEERKRRLENKFEGKAVPRPDFWGGFLVQPKSIEFWQGGKNRLHDRFKYRNIKGKWEVVRLAP